jgi:alanine racemase
LDLLDRLRPTRATIDLTRLVANYRAVSALVPSPIMPVVKADAYGHGAGPVAQALVKAGAPMLAVAYVEEAVALRAAGVGVPLVVMAGFSGAQVIELERHALTAVIGSASMLRLLIGRPKTAPRLSAHLKIDTGMTRLGLPPADAVAAAEALAATGTVDLVGILTHLASADEDGDATKRQLDEFDQTVARLAARGIRPGLVHASNSAGLQFHRPGHTLARPGLLLYGLRPRPLSPDVEVRPVMTLTTTIAAVREVAAGTGVSYGWRWRAPRPSRIATLPVGYADGVPRTRAMIERGFVMADGRRCPVAGNICMDLMMIDVTDAPAAGEGSTVTLLGDEPTAWDVADWADTAAWEALTRVGARIPRVYVEDGRLVSVDSKYRL